MLAVTLTTWLPRVTGWAIASSSLAASSSAASMTRGSLIRTTNSSPPSRAARSSRRSRACRRCAMVTSSSSPWSWPSVSLIVLKPSRSMNSRPKGADCGVAVRASSASCRCRRLPRPVSASCIAWWRSLNWVSRISLMSEKLSTWCVTCPNSSVTSQKCSSAGNRLPSARLHITSPWRRPPGFSSTGESSRSPWRRAYRKSSGRRPCTCSSLQPVARQKAGLLLSTRRWASRKRMASLVES